MDRRRAENSSVRDLGSHVVLVVRAQCGALAGSGTRRIATSPLHGSSPPANRTWGTSTATRPPNKPPYDEAACPPGDAGRPPGGAAEGQLRPREDRAVVQSLAMALRASSRVTVPAQTAF